MDCVALELCKPSKSIMCTNQITYVPTTNQVKCTVREKDLAEVKPGREKEKKRRSIDTLIPTERTMRNSAAMPRLAKLQKLNNRNGTGRKMVIWRVATHRDGESSIESCY